ncbi:MAG: radical SAM protein [Planctomycetota bacterium]
MSVTSGYIFGPVPSRRLGQSLGVDIVPFKTCSYDCVYCQLGRTTVKTLERREYTPVGVVLEDFDRKLDGGVAFDYATLSGSGEPTLHVRIGEVIAGLRRRTRHPVAVLTNGSLLWDPVVRRDIAGADLVIPSLDAGDEAGFQSVNRPHPDLTFIQMVEGLRMFREERQKPVWLEVLLVAGSVDIRMQAEAIARIVNDMAFDKIQLGTVTRPPAETHALPVPEDLLRAFSPLFEPAAEVVGTTGAEMPDGGRTLAPEMVLALLARRPCTVEDVAAGLGAHVVEAVKGLQELVVAGAVSEIRQDGRRYYRIAHPRGRGDVVS